MIFDLYISERWGKHPTKYCHVNDRIHVADKSSTVVYQDLEEAKLGCKFYADCGGIYNLYCSPGNYELCKTGFTLLDNDPVGSCVYVRVAGNIYGPFVFFSKMGTQDFCQKRIHTSINFIT